MNFKSFVCVFSIIVSCVGFTSCNGKKNDPYANILYGNMSEEDLMNAMNSLIPTATFSEIELDDSIVKKDGKNYTGKISAESDGNIVAEFMAQDGIVSSADFSYEKNAKFSMEWYFENLAIILEEDGNNPAALQGDSKGFEAYANFGQKKLSQEEVDEIFGTDFTKYKEQRISETRNRLNVEDREKFDEFVKLIPEKCDIQSLKLISSGESEDAELDFAEE